MSKLYDVFLYSGKHEHDMVRLRHLALKDHVDAMIAVSCNLTYQGENSPCEPPPTDLLGDGLIWAVVNATPFPDEEKSKWGGKNWGHIEYQHRDLVVDKLPEVLANHTKKLHDDDIVMLSDFDEIPDPNFFSEIVDCVKLFECVAVPMRMHGFALDYLYPGQLLYTIVSRYKDMKPQAQRNARYGLMRAGWGWHLSWLGDMEAKERKKKWFSHGELDDLDVEDCYKTGTHANGEELIKLKVQEMGKLSWPEPMFEAFKVPETWLSPSTYVAHKGEIILPQGIAEAMRDGN